MKLLYKLFYVTFNGQYCYKYDFHIAILFRMSRFSLLAYRLIVRGLLFFFPQKDDTRTRR